MNRKKVTKRGAYNMEEITKNVETQQPKRDEDSTSTVKTPLVDALRSYFLKGSPVDKQVEYGIGFAEMIENG